MEYLHIIDDDRDLLSSWERMFILEGYNVYTYSSVKSFTKNYENKGTEVIILDLDLKDEKTTGIELFKSFKEKNIYSPTILSSGHLDVENTEDFLCCGGYRIHQKGGNPLSLLKKVRSAMSQSKNNNKTYTQRETFYKGYNQLTKREKEVLKFALEDYSVEETAYKLNVKSCTVNAHRTKIFRKVGIDSINNLKLLCEQIKFTD